MGEFQELVSPYLWNPSYHLESSTIWRQSKTQAITSFQGLTKQKAQKKGHKWK